MSQCGVIVGERKRKEKGPINNLEKEKDQDEADSYFDIGDTHNSKLRKFPSNLNLSMIMIILVLSTCINSSNESLLGLHSSESPNQSVNRLSYGVIFDYYQDVVMTSEIWSHVFVIKLPQIFFREEQNFIEALHTGDAPARALCMRHNGQRSFYSDKLGISSCKRFESHVHFLITTATKSYQNLHAIIDDIYSLLPQSLQQSEDSSRQSRAILSFVGSWISSLTGLPSQEDLNALKRDMVQIEDFVNKEVNATQKFVADTTVILKLTNERIDHLIDEVNNRSIKTVKLIEKVDQNNINLIEFYANLTLHKFQFLLAIADLTTHYSNFLNAIELLSKGKLPSYLFTESVLTDMLKTIHSSVSREFGRSMEIVHTNAHHYYNRGTFICTRFKDNLYVKLNVPLTNNPDTFKIYRINTYPIPLHQHEYSHATQIQNVPDNIAISVRKGLYLPIREKEWQKFISHPENHIHRIFFKIKPYDCILPIFFNDKFIIKDQYTYSILL